MRENIGSLRDVFRGNIGVMAISWLLFSLTGSLVNPFFAKYAKDLGASDYDIALMRSLGMLGLALALIPGGLITDYFGRVKVIILGTGLVALSQFLFGLAPDWRFLLAVYVFDNIAHFYQPALTAIIMDSLRRGEEFKGFLGIGIVTSIPGLFMPIVGGYLYDAVGVLGIRAGFIIQGIVAVVVLILRIKALRETLRPANRELSKLIIELAGYRGVLTRALKLYIFTSLLWQLTLGVSATYSAIYVLEYLGISKPTWGLFASISTLGGMIASLYMINTRGNIRRLAWYSSMIISLCIMAISIPGFIGVNSLTIAVIAVSSLVSSIFSNLLNSSISAFLTKMLPQEVRGRAVGIQRLLDNLGSSLASQFAAFLYIKIGCAQAFLISGLIGIASSLYLRGVVKTTD